MEQLNSNILQELQDLKPILSTVIGTANGVGRDRFSAEALQQGAKLYQKMGIRLGDWVEEDDLPKSGELAP